MTLFTAPSSTTFLTDVGVWSGSLFTALLGIAVIIVGLSISGMLLSALIGATIKGVKKVTGGGRGRGGRRRR